MHTGRVSGSGLDLRDELVEAHLLGSALRAHRR
jgi:hypothetical protein